MVTVIVIFADAVLLPLDTVQVTSFGPVQLGQDAYNLTCEPLPTIVEDVFTDHVKVGLV